MPGAGLADWLALHGLTDSDCRTRLRQIRTEPPSSAAAAPAPDPDLAKSDSLPMVLAALGRAMPGAAPVLDRIGTEVRIDLAPDLNRFPRAFTLHDDGRGRPFVSCPLNGRLSDLLLLGHEIGHVCQLLGSGHAILPPLLRETAAYLAEELICTASGPTLQIQHRARTQRIMRRDGAALAQALDAPDIAYHYNWNYPLARDLAARAAHYLKASAQWQVFTGAADLPQLWRLPPFRNKPAAPIRGRG